MVLILVGASGTLERSRGSLPRRAPPQFSVQFPSTCSRTYKPQEAHRSQVENQWIRIRVKETRTPKHGKCLLTNLRAANPHRVRPGPRSQCYAHHALHHCSKALPGGQSSPQPDAALVPGTAKSGALRGHPTTRVFRTEHTLSAKKNSLLLTFPIVQIQREKQKPRLCLGDTHKMEPLFLIKGHLPPLDPLPSPELTHLKLVKLTDQSSRGSSSQRIPKTVRVWPTQLPATSLFCLLKGFTFLHSFKVPRSKLQLVIIRFLGIS